MPLRGRDQWHETAEATDAVATATHPGEAGKSHYVTHLSASHSGGNQPVRVDLKDGSTNALSWEIEAAPIEIDFSDPVQISVGNDVVVEIAALTGGVLGIVNIVGFTDDPA